VPTNPTTASTQKACAWEKARPVAPISRQAPNSSRLAGNRCPAKPTASVSAAEPRSVAVVSTPTLKALNPSVVR